MIEPFHKKMRVSMIYLNIKSPEQAAEECV